MIELDDMARKLWEKFPEYQRIKKKLFKEKVSAAFDEVVASYNTASEGATEKAKASDSEHDNSKEITISSGAESDASDAKTTKVSGKTMNQTVSNLYSSGKKSEKEQKPTDFDKIKTLAKETEKNMKSNDKPKIVEKKDEANKTEPKKISLSKKPVEVAKKDTEVKVVNEKPSSEPKSKKDTEVAVLNDKASSEPKSDPKPSKEVEMIDLEAEKQPKPKEVPATPMADKKNARPTSPTLKPVRKKKLETAFKESKVDFSDVAGMRKILTDLLHFMIGLETTPQKAQADENSSRSLLLHGPTGCGKTLLANAISGELKWPMLEVTSTEIVSGISGESEAKLRSLFDQAINAGHPCVIFMDEIEVIGQRKDNSSRGMDNRIISQLKSCIDSIQNSQVLFVAATNGLESLDLALRSRFLEIAIGIPDEKARQMIINSVTRHLSLDNDFDSAVLARLTPSFVGRDFKDLCREAAKVARKTVIEDLAEDENAENENDDFQSLRRVLKECKNDERLRHLKIKMDDFKSALKKIQPAAKREGFATIPDVTWKDVGALDEIRTQIELKVLARVNHPKIAKDMSLDSPTGVLLVGPPGCGKTLVAKAIANQAGINFISVKGPELLNMVSFAFLLLGIFLINSNV